MPKMKIEVVYMKGGDVLPEFDEDDSASISIIWDMIKEETTLDSGSRLIYFKGGDRVVIGQDETQCLQEVNHNFQYILVYTGLRCGL